MGALCGGVLDGGLGTGVVGREFDFVPRTIAPYRTCTLLEGGGLEMHLERYQHYVVAVCPISEPVAYIDELEAAFDAEKRRPELAE